MTLVLRGTIALSSARFPRGTLSPMLDTIARVPIWEHGLDYGHGTGHGVGYFLNVHEGPQSFSRVIPEAIDGDGARHDHQRRAGPLPAGALGRAGREPGAVGAGGRAPSEFGDFLEFETLTLCPIDARCLEPRADARRRDRLAECLSRTVRERLAPLVSGDALAWLNLRTAPLA